MAGLFNTGLNAGDTDRKVFAHYMTCFTSAPEFYKREIMLAQHYGVAVQRVSTAILISTVISIVTVSPVVGWVTGL